MQHSLFNINPLAESQKIEYNLVANPIYNISMRGTASIPQQQTVNKCTVTTVAREDTAVTYEEVTINFRGNKPVVQV